MAKKNKSKIKKIIVWSFLSVLLIVIIIGGIYAYHVYEEIYKPNVFLKGKNSEYLYIRTGSTFEDVTDLLYEKKYILNKKSFEWVAQKKNYCTHVKPGRYLLKNKMSNNELVSMLRSGDQEPVDVTFNNIRTKKELASAVSKYIEADSTDILDLLDDKNFLDKFDFTPHTVISMFIPNTYEFYWNTTAEQFFKRMNKEYTDFWTGEKTKKAEKIGFTKLQVSTLASIVEVETIKNDEKPSIAGVYMNRIKKGIKLQADPTVIFAIGDFTIKRVLREYLNYNSPYNTYLYAGLPPGPICLPSISSINAVLNYERHSYIFFCAKEDFSGYHNFAKTLQQHSIYAKKYQAALNKLNIKK